MLGIEGLVLRVLLGKEELARIDRAMRMLASAWNRSLGRDDDAFVDLPLAKLHQLLEWNALGGMKWLFERRYAPWLERKGDEHVEAS